MIFNTNWYFLLDDNPDYADISLNESRFRKVTLPHDWCVDYVPDQNEPTGGGGGYSKSGIGWYRKHFLINQLEKDEKVYLYFEGIYMDSSVYINGKLAGTHGYGYTSFYVDISRYLKEGENLVAVRVKNAPAPNSRWYSGAGIYRDVHMIRTSSVHFDHFGIRCATNRIFPEKDLAELQIRARVVNERHEDITMGVFHKIYDQEDNLISTSGIALHIAAGDTSDCMVRPSIRTPHCWSDTDPYLYTLVSTLMIDGEEVDSFSCKTGIRTATFDANQGFLLNGNPIKIKGMCLHHDCGLTGAVGYREVWERRLKLLKDMMVLPS